MAAGALLALGGVEEVFAVVISRPALDLLRKSGRHRLQALRAAYRQPYAYRPVSVGNPLRRIANARRVPGTGNGFYRDDETGGIGAAGAFRLLSGMRVICSTLYKETAPGYFRPERESVRFGIFSSFFAGSCWNKADCFRIFV